MEKEKLISKTKNRHIPSFQLSEKIDIKNLLKEDEENTKLDLPFRFGVAFKADIGLKDGKWEETQNGRT